MMRALYGLRRKLAHYIFPEMVAQTMPRIAEDCIVRVQPKVREVGHRDDLIALADALSAYDGVTHFAISMRIFRKGDFFKKLKAGGDCRTATAGRVMAFFDRCWPEDLEWPRDIPRPSKSKKEAA